VIQSKWHIHLDTQLEDYLDKTSTSKWPKLCHIMTTSHDVCRATLWFLPYASRWYKRDFKEASKHFLFAIKYDRIKFHFHFCDMKNLYEKQQEEAFWEFLKKAKENLLKC
jgi:hypothetical protein